MKTDSIKQCIGLVRMGGYSSLPSNAAEELKALEESHAEMAKTLRVLLHSATNGYRLFPSDAQAIEAALRKADAL